MELTLREVVCESPNITFYLLLESILPEFAFYLATDTLNSNLNLKITTHRYNSSDGLISGC
jgi:hypothetical protein